ncbi:MAG: asparagine synthase (glutamine-hydrolyzing) [Acidobacteria bacterium]|nr:asparagine synthase (glutamine-hydrolyzing) [Acidobacteriota bacterium]
MCGIAGVYRSGDAGDDRPVVQSMLDAMKLRGPDGEGIASEGPVTLGHRRLAIVDLSANGSQPMRSSRGDLVVTFNGEIYNFRELIDEMGIDRRALRSTSDTEILLLAWEKWGSACLDRLAGQFAFALYESGARRLWLARDRFGEKPLYYHRAAGTLAFSSSIGALLKAGWVSRETSRASLVEYLALRYVVSPRTVMSEVVKLSPGHLLKIDAGGMEIRRWWAPRFRRAGEGARPLTRHEAAEEFGHRLVRAARRCTVGDVPVALLLSDGIDSNGIHAALGEAGVDVTTYTYKAVSENAASGAAGAAGGRHAVSYDEILAQLQPAFSNLTEPIGDGAAFGTWSLIRAARPTATVFLCGHGGDEVLGGYRLSQERFRLAALSRACAIPLPALMRWVDLLTNGDEPVAQRRAALLRAPLRLVPAAARYLTQRPLPPGDVADLFAPALPPERYLGVIDRLYGNCDGEASALDRIQEVMLHTFLSAHVVSYADSASMASSAELRLPYLDRDLVDLILSLPPSMRVSPWPGVANTKRILRWWAKGRVPETSRTQRKRGFRFGNMRELLGRRGDWIRGTILGSAALRRHLPGLPGWISQPVEVYRRGREGTFWALLAYAIWGEAAGVT